VGLHRCAGQVELGGDLYADAGPLSAELLPNGTLKTYLGFSHGMPTTQADTVSADILAFVQS
jgi:non-heme chloroperoxidase